MDISTIKYCDHCPHHKIINDKDPYDWFNNDDKAIVCTKTSNPNEDHSSKWLHDHSKYRPIDISLRPYQIKQIIIPGWCPLSLTLKAIK